MKEIEGLRTQFHTSIPKALRGIWHDEWRSQSVGINVAFGVTGSELPARFLAGFVPAFSLSDALVEQNQALPEIRVFVPLHLSMKCNGTSKEQGDRNIQQGMVFIQKFRDVFHPSVRWFIDIDNPLSADALSLLTNLSDAIIDDPGLAASWHHIFDTAKNGGNNDASLYAVHHIFGWQDVWKRHVFFDHQPKQITINCFSQSEEAFQAVRRRLMMHVSNEHPDMVVHGRHIDLITRRCPGPHYIQTKARGIGEPTLSDLLSAGFRHTKSELISLITSGFHTALKDLESIEKHIDTCRRTDAGLPNVEEFIQEIDSTLRARRCQRG